GPGVGGQDVEDAAAPALPDPVPGHGPGAVEGPVQHDVDHGVPAVDGQFLGGTDEVAGGVVDQDVDAAEPVQGRLDHVVHLLRVADIHGHYQGLAAPGFDLGGGSPEVVLVAAGKDQPGTQPAELQGHGLAQARPAPRSEEH